MADKYVKSIRSAMYSTPTDYLESRKYYEGLLDAKIKDTYQFAPNTYEIETEDVVGTMEFSKVLCRVCHAIDPKTGMNLGDDFKDLKFFDLDYDIFMGKRFRFDDSIWIATNTDDYKYTTKSCVVRRCNNVLKYINNNGDIVEEPCVIEYALKYSNVYFNDAVQIPQATISIITQNNNNSNSILINDRFIFGKQVYKIKSIEDFLRNTTYDTVGSPTITFTANLDSTAADDDFELGIASMDKYKDIYPKHSYTGNHIEVVPNQDYVLQSDTVVFSCYAYDNNDKKLDDEFVFTCNSPLTPNYRFDIIDGNHYAIYNHKMDLSQFISVTCTSGELSETYNYQLRGLF